MPSIPVRVRLDLTIDGGGRRGDASRSMLYSNAPPLNDRELDKATYL